MPLNAQRERIRFTIFLLVCLTIGAGANLTGVHAQGLEPSGFPLETDPLTIPPPPLTEQERLEFDVPSITEPVTPSNPWYMPWTWFPMDGWTNTAELGMNGSAGNAESFAFQTGLRSLRKTDISSLDLKLTHNRTNANGIETQNNTLFYADYDRPIKGSPWAWFSKFGLEYDEFRAFDLRLNVNGGISYAWYDTEALTLSTRFGSGTSREFGGPDNSWVPEAVFGATYEHQITERNKLLAKVDYFPAWNRFSDYRLVIDGGWEYLVTDDGNLSLKLGFNDRYDSTPNGAKPNDLNYNALLLYKF